MSCTAPAALAQWGASSARGARESPVKLWACVHAALCAGAHVGPRARVCVCVRVRRAFEDADIIHVEDRVDPVADLEIIHSELRAKDRVKVRVALHAGMEGPRDQMHRDAHGAGRRAGQDGAQPSIRPPVHVSICTHACMHVQHAWMTLWQPGACTVT